MNCKRLLVVPQLRYVHSFLVDGSVGVRRTLKKTKRNQFRIVPHSIHRVNGISFNSLRNINGQTLSLSCAPLKQSVIWFAMWCDVVICYETAAIDFVLVKHSTDSLRVFDAYVTSSAIVSSSSPCHPSLGRNVDDRRTESITIRWNELRRTIIGKCERLINHVWISYSNTNVLESVSGFQLEILLFFSRFNGWDTWFPRLRPKPAASFKHDHFNDVRMYDTTSDSVHLLVAGMRRAWKRFIYCSSEEHVAEWFSFQFTNKMVKHRLLRFGNFRLAFHFKLNALTICGHASLTRSPDASQHTHSFNGVHCSHQVLRHTKVHSRRVDAEWRATERETGAGRGEMKQNDDTWWWWWCWLDWSCDIQLRNYLFLST